MRYTRKQIDTVNIALQKEKIYDEYMPFTLEVEGYEYIDNYLGIVVDYLDSHKEELSRIAEKFYSVNPYFKSVENRMEFLDISDEEYSEMRDIQKKYYQELQELLITDRDAKNKDGVSDRKGVNTFIKYGFVRPLMAGYVEEAIRYLNATSQEEKECIIGQVFYTYGSTFTSYTQNYSFIDGNRFEDIKFIFRTLYASEKKYLSKQDMCGIMITVPNSLSTVLNDRNLELIKKGYLSDKEMVEQYNISQYINLLKTKAIKNGIRLFEKNLNDIIQTGIIKEYPFEVKRFESRKYNQIGYMRRTLAKYPGLMSKGSGLYISVLYSEHVEYEKEMDKKRDSVKHRIYKNFLLKESQTIYSRIVCYADKLPWKALVASHIWAYNECRDSGNEELAFDLNNGLLLSPNIDAYFDKNNISFDENGKILITANKEIVPDEIRDKIKNYVLDAAIMNEGRKKYLKIHREKFWENEKQY